MRRGLILIVLLAACTTPIPAPALRTVPSMSCDVRMVEHNRRECHDRGGSFREPVQPGTCGVCAR